MSDKRLSKMQYVLIFLSMFLYAAMLTDGFGFLDVDNDAIVDLLFISTVNGVERCYLNLLSRQLRPYAIFLMIDALFIILFYPLLISISKRKILPVSAFILAGIGDLLENSFTAGVMISGTYQVEHLYIPVLATNIKFCFLLTGTILLLFGNAGRLRKRR